MRKRKVIGTGLMGKLKFQVVTSNPVGTKTIGRHIIEMNELLVTYRLRDYVSTINYYNGHVLSIIGKDGEKITNKLVGLDEDRFEFIHKLLNDMNASLN